MPTDTRLLAGAMSGTSADGVDVAITRVTGHGLEMSAQLVHHHHRPYDPALRQAIFAVRSTGRTDLRELARIGREVSLTYATAVNESLSATNLKATDLSAIAAHGQTLFHEVPLTIQYFDPSLVAYEVGCPVISDFRRADLAAGGQGAPLVPFADYILFRHQWKHRVLLNIGGISNLTFVEADATIENLIAYDTGPGNCISDHVMRQHDPQGPGFDRDGNLAIQSTGYWGDLSKRVLASPYFAQPHPKSTDGPAMVALFEEARRSSTEAIPLPDLLAAACSITAGCIIDAVRNLPYAPDEVILSGGGAKNKCIVGFLQDGLGCKLLTTEQLGVPADAKEAIAFALLGAATLDGLPSNVPSVTGARRGVILGSITPKP